MEVTFSFSLCLIFFVVSLSLCQNEETSVVLSENVTFYNSSQKADDNIKVIDNSEVATDYDPVKQTREAEAALKRLMKNGVKRILPTLMNFNSESGVSKKCVRSFLKFISGLTSVKLWAVKMLDATSKPPSGLFEGTISDFGAFDQCLDITVPLRNGSEEFRGSYCAVEVKPRMPPMPRNFSLAQRRHAGPLESVGNEILVAGGFFYYLNMRFGVCVPSTCNAEDMNIIAKPIAKLIKMEVAIPRCYVKEPTKFETIQIIVIFALVLLTMLAALGTVVDILSQSRKLFGGKYRGLLSFLLCFSLTYNFKKLFSASKGPGQLKALHGIRTLSIAWVILGHTYVWTNFGLLRRAMVAQDFFHDLDMEVIINGWLSVEPFFLLSGLLTSYACLQIMEKTKGKLNIPFFIIRRYIRLMPSLLIVMGLMFLLPLISSGPFWYERMDPEIQSCRNNWWTNLLFINNWTSMLSICIHPTWYLAADFQLHIFSIIVLYALYRSSLFGFVTMGIFTVMANVTIAVITYLWDLPPFIQISSANAMKITQTVDLIHIRTFSHVGPYCVGLLVGYLVLKHRDMKLSKMTLVFCWISSFVLSVASIYGVHPWSMGELQPALLTCAYGALHRTTFAAGVAWVAFACITGHAGLVNKFLSCSVFAPFSRLTFMAYLIQSLVIWVRAASVRERMFYSHYNMLYEYTAHVVVVFILAVPLHLLVEAPVSNMDRLLFSRLQKSHAANEPTKDEHPQNNHVSNANGNVELRSVKSLPRETMSNGINGRTNGWVVK